MYMDEINEGVEECDHFTTKEKQDYLVLKISRFYGLYDVKFYDSGKKAWAHTTVNDIVLVCKPNTVYYCNGWAVDKDDIIRKVRRGGKSK